MHCWEKTQLLRAWMPSVQMEAVTRAEDLFPIQAKANPVDHLMMPLPQVNATPIYEDAPPNEDPDALHPGDGFAELADRDTAVRRSGRSGLTGVAPFRLRASAALSKKQRRAAAKAAARGPPI